MLSNEAAICAANALKRVGPKARQGVINAQSHPLTPAAMGAEIFRACENPMWGISRAWDGLNLPRLFVGMEDLAAVGAAACLAAALAMPAGAPGRVTTVSFWLEMAELAGPAPEGLTLADAYAQIAN